MSFNKEDFIKTLKDKIAVGVEVDLDVNGCFGYFEMTPYSKDEVIKCIIRKIKNGHSGISLYCSTRYKEFSTGFLWIDEMKFLQYAKYISYHTYAKCPEWLTSIFDEIKRD